MILDKSSIFSNNLISMATQLNGMFSIKVLVRPANSMKLKEGEMIYEIKCAWCGRSMGTKVGKGNRFIIEIRKSGLPIISHSICEVCKRQQIKKNLLLAKIGS